MESYRKFREIVTQISRNEPIKVSCIVGAGMSAGSGLSTFRGQDGLYQDRNPMELASRQGFEKDPILVWTWYRDRIRKVFETEPNPGHYALVELEQAGMLDLIVTQNVDGLHLQAGQSSDKLIEIHGTLSRIHCLDRCGLSYELSEPPEDVPVMCECGSYQRPSVVWFGEGIREDIYQIINDLRQSNILFIIGTSGTVFPVARLPYQVGDDVTVVNINPDPSGFDQITDIEFRNGAEEVLPKLVEILKSTQNREDR